MPVISKDTKCLQKSYQLGREVRVIRASTNPTSYAPTAGYRYDGLYVITAQQQSLNMKGGAYLRFRFERLGGQPPLDGSRPTIQEKRLFDRVRDGY